MKFFFLYIIICYILYCILNIKYMLIILIFAGFFWFEVVRNKNFDFLIGIVKIFWNFNFKKI